MGKDRTAMTLLRFFRMYGKSRSDQLKYVCSDMWRAYLKVIAKKAGGAVHVLDRFHIMQKMNKAIDEVRAAEGKGLAADGYEPVLKHSRWCLLKRRENLIEKQAIKLSELLKYNLQSVRSHLLSEDFQREPRTPSRTRIPPQILVRRPFFVFLSSLALVAPAISYGQTEKSNGGGRNADQRKGR
jgi:transposase